MSHRPRRRPQQSAKSGSKELKNTRPRIASLSRERLGNRDRFRPIIRIVGSVLAETLPLAAALSAMLAAKDPTLAIVVALVLRRAAEWLKLRFGACK